jgi:ribosomal RNA-processing protein 36
MKCFLSIDSFLRFKEALATEKTMNGKKSFKRLNKNRPQEITSKRPVKLYREVFHAEKVERIDPRFSNAFGEYKPDYFSKNYEFINDMRENEIKVLEEQMKQEPDSQERNKIKLATQRLVIFRLSYAVWTFYFILIFF